MKPFIYTSLAIFSVARADDSTFTNAVIEEKNETQISCLQEQFEKAAVAAGVNELPELEFLQIEIDAFNLSQKDETKADVVFVKMAEDRPAIAKRYSLRLSAVDNSVWRLADSGDGRLIFLAPTMKAVGEFFDFSDQSEGHPAQKFLFNVDIEKCRWIIEAGF